MEERNGRSDLSTGLEGDSLQKESRKDSVREEESCMSSGESGSDAMRAERVPNDE